MLKLQKRSYSMNSDLSSALSLSLASCCQGTDRARRRGKERSTIAATPTPLPALEQTHRVLRKTGKIVHENNHTLILQRMTIVHLRTRISCQHGKEGRSSSTFFTTFSSAFFCRHCGSIFVEGGREVAVSIDIAKDQVLRDLMLLSPSLRQIV